MCHCAGVLLLLNLESMAVLFYTSLPLSQAATNCPLTSSQPSPPPTPSSSYCKRIAEAEKYTLQTGWVDQIMVACWSFYGDFLLTVYMSAFYELILMNIMGSRPLYEEIAHRVFEIGQDT